MRVCGKSKKNVRAGEEKAARRRYIREKENIREKAAADADDDGCARAEGIEWRIMDWKGIYSSDFIWC